ncbi:MucR family transcriptional regulator [Mesorhizobium sangaii]|uniref:Putative transcriptional regulator n=1 Tax=Mesorhizobium sangaii TaxID=505389 RepID=A0A841P7P2_9HYPH|nr:MucR family transcriptional regulator [Mesorhizobium sangaii]MBB6411314.1 putative transcriptional regulator [Mesorhizobium sangaii]
MTNDTDNHAAALAELTAEVVSAYVSNNPLPAASLPDLIASVHLSLSGLTTPAATPVEPLVPAVNPKRSVFPDYIISLEDGRKFKSMKRHLGLLGMTPDQYRAKWSLPRDYPMVAPSYSNRRSALAKASGLGRKAEPAAPAKKAAAKRTAKA